MYTLWASWFFCVLLISIKHKLCRGTIYWTFLPKCFQLAWWFHRRRLKCRSLRTTTDAKRWLCIAWLFGSSELIRCYQISHLPRHRDARNVLPADATRDVGLIAATYITPTDPTLCRYIIGFTEFCLKYSSIFLLWQGWQLWEGLTCGIAYGLSSSKSGHAYVVCYRL
jgi:hypothetical protein